MRPSFPRVAANTTKGPFSRCAPGWYSLPRMKQVQTATKSNSGIFMNHRLPNSTNRRGFLKALGLATAAGALPFHLHASDKAGRRLPIVGTGHHTYEVQHDWAQLPVGQVWGNTHG